MSGYLAAIREAAYGTEMIIRIERMTDAEFDAAYPRLLAQVQEKMAQHRTAQARERQARRQQRRLAAIEAARQHRSDGKVICAARTRRGTACECKPEPGKARCRFHGGKSTGPRTPEGRAAIAESNRRRARRPEQSSEAVVLFQG